MALQSDQLVLFGLGVKGDLPATDKQPTLDDGMHLRWFFNPTLGFPHYGFYLFRRPAQADAFKYLSQTPQMQALRAGTLGTSVDLGLATLSSEQAISATNTIAPQHLVEFTVGSAPLLLTLKEPARAVRVDLGASDATLTVEALCDGVTVAQQSASQAQLTLRADCITAVRIGRPLDAAGSSALLDVAVSPVSAGAQAEWMPLKEFAYPLGLPVSHPSYPCALGGAPSYERARQLEQQRTRYGSPSAVPPIEYQAGTIDITRGSALVLGAGTAWTSKYLGYTLRVTGDPDAYIVTAVLSPTRLALSRPITGQSRAGATYQLAKDPFAELYNDALHLVEQGAAGSPMFNRALPDPIFSAGQVAIKAGETTVTGINTSWPTTLAGLSLQVRHGTAGTVTLRQGSADVVGSGSAWDESMVGMIFQPEGSQASFVIAAVSSPTLLTLERPYMDTSAADKSYKVFNNQAYTIAEVISATQLRLDTPFGQPDVTGRSYRITARLASPEPAGATASAGPAALEQHHPLDLLLLASLEPAPAQVLGLYWIDATAAPDKEYDYLLLADYSGQARLNVWTAWELVRAGRFDGFEAAIAFKRRMPSSAQGAPPHPGPLELYALPGVETPPRFTSNSVGLRWSVGVTQEGALIPDRPLFYHIWRASLGQNKPSAAPADSAYTLITQDAPIIVSEPWLPAGTTPEAPADWPPFAMHAVDNGMADGWYSYQVSGVDMFGRHTVRTAPGAWKIWNPRPDPLPWYARQLAANETTVNSFAIALLDTLPPPVPTAVEAYALDPKDDTVVADQAYLAWRAARGESVVGLRVRWRWTALHMAQARDTKEFRLYYHPGSGQPGDRPADTAAWTHRFAVVRYDDATAYTTEPDGSRVYDVLLPRAATDSLADNAFFTGMPLQVTEEKPIAFASVGVSAADDKTHGEAVDPRGATGALSGRKGNEGRIGQPATIYRVYRVPPPPPELPPMPEGKLYASPADYHSQSFFTYRWVKKDEWVARGYRMHILRAMDETLFRVDWGLRRSDLSGLATSPDKAYFPSYAVEPRWTATKRQQVADELNQLNPLKEAYKQAVAAQDVAAQQRAKSDAFAYYRALSVDALRVLANLPGNEAAFTQLTVEPLELGASADRKGPDSPASYVPSATLCAYVDALDGRATNRYFYRSVAVNQVHERSAALSLSTPPVWLPDVTLPATPKILKALGGNRQATLQWGALPSGRATRYRIYRSDSREAAADVRLMGDPVVELPAEPLVVQGGTVDLGPGTKIARAERVYAAAGFDPKANLLTGQTAPQYLAAPKAPTGTTVGGLSAPNGTAVVVVYTDQQGGLQYTAHGLATRAWTSYGLVGARDYFFRVVALRNADSGAGLVQLASQPSLPASTRIADLTPPQPPTITTAEWVRVGADGTVYGYTAPIPDGETRVPAVRLVWTAPDPALTCLVQCRTLPIGSFENASGWLPRGTYQAVLPNEYPYFTLEYRIKVLSQAGNANETYSIKTLPAVA